MAAVPVALAVAGMFKAGSSLAAAHGNAAAMRMEDEFNREMTKVNVELLENQRQDVLASGAAESGKVRAAAQRFKESQKAAFAAQGVDVGSGSAALIQEDTAYLGEIDALETKNNARKAAYGYTVQKREAVMQQNFNSMASRNQQKQTIVTGGMQAIGAVAETFSSVNSYYHPKVKG
jgi:hypothetical protein